MNVFLDVNVLYALMGVGETSKKADRVLQTRKLRDMFIAGTARPAVSRQMVKTAVKTLARGRVQGVAKMPEKEAQQLVARAIHSLRAFDLIIDPTVEDESAVRRCASAKGHFDEDGNPDLDDASCILSALRMDCIFASFDHGACTWAIEAYGARACDMNYGLSAMLVAA